MPATKSFSLHVGDVAIADLRSRLERTRWPDEPPLEAWSTGTSTAYAKEIAAYWQTGFDWRAWEAKLNAFQQFTVPIGGIDLHFIHEPGRGPDPIPLLISHGWPGSVFEFYKLIPLLTERFTIVAPSLPGYTLSFKPGQKRFAVEEIAEVFAALMTRRARLPAVRRTGRRLGRFRRLGIGTPSCRKRLGPPPQYASRPPRSGNARQPDPPRAGLPRAAQSRSCAKRPAISGFKAHGRKRWRSASPIRPLALPPGC